jgi:TPR repeat protein
VSRRVWHLAIVVGIAAVAGAIGVSLLGERQDHPAESIVMPADAARIDATTRLAKQNDPVAAYELSRMHAAGQGVPRSEKERLVWLERAAQHGQPDAQFELGIALREGRGVIQDYEKAAIWLQRSAESGNGYAQFELGRMYRAGAGFEVDNVKAYIWLNLAAAQGIAGADVARDAVLRQLTPAEIGEAQAEARRIAEAHQQRSAAPAGKP